ncbi:MAG: 30S ribosomal protein THX [Cyclobacteriaceae bacterium]|jgi:ribosomal small subunit protein bTHX
MGKGDKKSKKGKIWRDSYGNKRNRNKIRLRLKRLSSVKKKVAAVEGEKTKVRRPARKKESAD